MFPRPSFFFFHDTAPTEIYTLSLHDALPISRRAPIPSCSRSCQSGCCVPRSPPSRAARRSSSDRKSTRLNSSHRCISYAVFCLKKKKKKKDTRQQLNAGNREKQHRQEE